MRFRDSSSAIPPSATPAQHHHPSARCKARLASDDQGPEQDPRERGKLGCVKSSVAGSYSARAARASIAVGTSRLVTRSILAM
jgi:hypothetical protein